MKTKLIQKLFSHYMIWMIVSLMIGRAGSQGLLQKNTRKILGKSLCEYPLIACKKSKYIERIFVSTDCKIIKKISRKYIIRFDLARVI